MLIRNIGKKDIYTAEGKLSVGGYLDVKEATAEKLEKMYPENIENISDIQKKVDKAKEQLIHAEQEIEKANKKKQTK